MALNSVEELIQDIRLGKMVILMDDEDRENEGDLVMAAECVRAEHINFMAKHARGLICLTLTEERCEQLALPLMVSQNDAKHGTNFTVSIEAREGVTTGISAADRAHTVRTAVARNARPGDVVQPGHIFPLKAQRGGVLVRAGHTEAGCDLARLGGFEPASVIVEIMNEDGTMARRTDLERFAEQHRLKIGTIADLIQYRMLNERTVEKVSEAAVNTDYGEFTLHTYRDLLAGDIHFALVKGDITPEEPTLVRVQMCHVVRDLFCTQPPGPVSWNMQRSLKRIASEGKGVVVLLAESETVQSMLDSVAIAQGHKPVPNLDTDRARNSELSVGLGSQILSDLNARKLRIMAPPTKYNALSGFELEVVEFVAPEE